MSWVGTYRPDPRIPAHLVGREAVAWARANGVRLFWYPRRVRITPPGQAYRTGRGLVYVARPDWTIHLEARTRGGWRAVKNAGGWGATLAAAVASFRRSCAHRRAINRGDECY